jgi:tRNA A-37 threonylcarbamoyl transferase component Bud32
VLQVLEKHGVPAPHVYGICADPHAMVMQALPGHTRFATAKDDADRSPQRFFSLSAQIQRERKACYDILERRQKGTLDVTNPHPAGAAPATS